MMKFFHFLISPKLEFGSMAIFTPLSFKLSFPLPFLIVTYSQKIGIALVFVCLPKSNFWQQKESLEKDCLISLEKLCNPHEVMG